MGGGDGVGFIAGIAVVLMFGIGVMGVLCGFIFIPILKLLKMQLRNNRHFLAFSNTFYFYIVCFLALCVVSFMLTIMLDMAIPDFRYTEEKEFGFLSLIGHFKIHIFIFVIVLCLVPSLAIYFLIRLRISKKISFGAKDSLIVNKKLRFLLSIKVFVISMIFFIVSFFVYLAAMIIVLFLIETIYEIA